MRENRIMMKNTSEGINFQPLFSKAKKNSLEYVRKIYERFD